MIREPESVLIQKKTTDITLWNHGEIEATSIFSGCNTVGCNQVLRVGPIHLRSADDVVTYT